LSTSNKFQEFVANKLSGLIMWAHMGVPIGILAAGFAVGLIGGFFLITGLLIQFIAALQDLGL
jgi:hypothetical protein